MHKIMAAAGYRPLPAQYRQGDVLLVPCDGIPDRVTDLGAEAGRVILARGETTGHAHAMAAERVRYFREDGSGQGFIRVYGPSAVPLTHEEHGEIPVAPGDYRVVQQREYEPKARPRTVAD